MNNKACCWVLGILIVGGILITVLSGLMIGSLALRGARESAVAEGSYLVVELTGQLLEHRTTPSLEMWARRQPTLSQILTSLERAQDDPRIAGVILRPMGTSGFAELRELRRALTRFRESGKPVYAYLEFGTDRDYYLASAADTVVMIPSRSGGLILTGLSVSSTYLAKTFRKLGIEFHVLHAGTYKGAYENLGSESMSAALRESLDSVLSDLFDTYTAEILASRAPLPDSILSRLILNPDKLVITGDEAVRIGMADLSLDWGEFRQRLSDDRGEFRTVSPVRYSRTRLPSAAADEIAVVFAEGTISFGSQDDPPWNAGEGIASENFVRVLRDLRENERVKAVVLRVNSPGGSALASDIILQELKRLKREKPVVVSMGNVAASGGYYISCDASHIIAEPNTITGSIGVVSVIPSAEKLYEKIGARVETVEKGKWAEFFRLDREFTTRHETVLSEYMRGIYDEFLSHVSNGRGLSNEQLLAAADGRIWTGRQALKLGLVDELGGWNEAIEKACELAELDRERISVGLYPKMSGWMEFLLERFDVSALSIRMNLPAVESERELRWAIEYLTEFYRHRDFVQTLMPLELP